MAVQRRFTCSSEDVFAVLRDGWLYPLWVVGATSMRDVDEGWPEPGTRLHHAFGVWPMTIEDITEVLDFEPDRRLVMEAHGWPVGKARVVITVEPDTEGCLVSIAEDVSGGPARLVPEPIRLAGMDVRNRECLRRLAYIAEGRQSARQDQTVPLR
jgi:polyketide cyclase/dehydrase/lipid transport protein